MRKRGTILIADDEQAIVRMLGEILRRAGCEVIEAIGSDDAVRLLQSCAVDLIVADREIRGISGLLAAARRSCERQPVGVVFLSSYSHPELSPSNVLPKPFSTEELQRKVAEALSGNRP